MDEPLAKPDQGLLDHLQQVAELGKEIAQRLQLSLDLQKRAVMACWLHDIGKALNVFQEYIRTVVQLEEAKRLPSSPPEIKNLEKALKRKRAEARNYPHALISMIPTFVIEKLALDEPLLATAAVLSHHSPLSEALYEHYESPPRDLGSLQEVIALLFIRLRQEGIEIYNHNLTGIIENVQRLLREPPVGIMKEIRPRLYCLPRKEFAAVKCVLHLADWLASSNRSDPSVFFLEGGAQAIKNYLRTRSFSLHSFQKQAAEAATERLALQAPTGTGKTEALLLWAGDAERIIYLLPTQATVNAMWKRLQGVYGKDAVGLAHGHSGYILRKTYDEEILDHRLFASAFAKPVVVATLDQYLIGHLQGRHWEERLTLSERSTLIFDEIHAYEPYTLGLLHEALRSFPPKRFVVASATLPLPVRSLLGTAMEIRAEESLWMRKRHRLVLHKGEIEEGIPEIIEEVGSGKRVLVIANTVAKAQELYQELRNHGISPAQLKLLHSRFVFRDRMRKEEELKDEVPGVILIATQVIEISLDISFDILFTELAPIDALVQRMGRVNRRGLKPPAPVKIYMTLDEGSGAIYGNALLKESTRLIRNLPEEPSDWDLAQAANKLYQFSVEEEAYKRDFELGKATLREHWEALGCYTINFSDEELRRRFVVRKRGYLSMGVLPKTLEEEARNLSEIGEKWRLVELLVPIPAYWVSSRCWGELFWASEELGVYVCELPYNSEIGVRLPKRINELPSYEFV